MWSYLIIIFITGSIFAVSTQFIDHFDFGKLGESSFSNISFLANGGIRLSEKWSVLYETDGIIWSMDMSGDDFLIGTGDEARLIRIRDGESETVFEKTNYVLFSDVAIMDKKTVVAAFPDGPVYELNSKFKETEQYEVDSKYVWDIVPADKGYYLLCGNPGAIYYVDGKAPELITELSNQDNLIKGLIIGDELYFIGDKYLLKLKEDKVIALASFDTTIADFVFYDDSIYLITAGRDEASLSGRANEQNQVMKSYEDKDVSDSVGKSRLYEVSLDGVIQKLYETSEVKFLSLSVIDYEFIVGTDKDGGFYRFSDSGNLVSYTALGTGKYVKTYQTDDAVYAIMMYPDRIVKFEDEFADEGFIVSKVVDTENVSTFGVPYIEDDVYPNTGYSIETRTGMISDTELWEDWVALDETVQSSPGRYIQYRVNFTSTGQYTAALNDLSIPYVQQNIRPRISDISVTYNSSYLTHKWTAYDPNGDTLQYDFYLAMDESDWVKINDDPIETATYTLSYAGLPTGVYRAKVIATDLKDNIQSTAKTAYIIGEDFYIDSNPPIFSDVKLTAVQEDYTLTFSVTDSLLPIKAVQYMINGDEWLDLLPEDGMYDSLSETVQVTYDSDVPCYIQFKATDLIGNAATKGIMLK